MTFRVLFPILLLSLLISCQEKEAGIPDIKGQEIDLQVVRYDQILQGIKGPEARIKLMEAQKQFPIFSDLFFKQILPLKGNSVDSLAHYISLFNKDKRINQLYHKVDSLYADFTPLEKEIEKALSYYKHYIPNYPTPTVYTFISEYSYQNFIFPDSLNDGIGIGLDMFLGTDYPYKKLDPHNSSFSDYLTRAFDKEHMTKKVMESVIIDRLGPPSGNKMIDLMIHNGKKIYLLDKVLPSYPDSIIMEYSRKQMQWVEDNALEIYSFFLDKELFYESKTLKINKYIAPSPSSPGMPDIAPGRTANYIGWQIVKSYMEKHPDVTISELFDMKDSQKFLDDSSYKPKRKKK